MLPETILVANKTNIRYFSNFTGTAGHVVLDKGRGFLFTDARYHLVAKAVLPSSYTLIDTTNGFMETWKKFYKSHKIHEVGIEGNDVTLQFFKTLKKNSSGVKLVDVGDELNKKRMIKTNDELKKIQTAQKITDGILEILKRWITPGVSEKAIAWKIECLARELGADGISFPAIVGFNEHSAAPHHQVSEQKLKRDDMILIDMGVVYQGYCSDMTRVLFTKQPTKLQAEVYELVRLAQETAIKKLHAGVHGKEIDSIARSVIIEAGYGDHFTHSLGHGVGLEIHELPNLSRHYEREISAKSVVTVEPGIYLEGKFGVRLEDMLVVNEKDATNITASPKALKSAIIKI
ncbi:MAG: Peptidase M24 [Candidatus Peregrinibacteria bacterium GW2011_GWA2_47_7]|nr:MAG: Peptidase M24 [Candidatus Peregrinibacteria bacterium GW2011_GWA2_47_7]